jgi:class 3 adenylate cyclase
MAAHAGACAERGGDYAGPVVNRAARLLEAGHGGQVLVTAGAYALLAGRLPGGIGLRTWASWTGSGTRPARATAPN